MNAVQVTKKDHIQGSLSAPIILVEYGDFECSYCGKAYPIVKQIQEKFGDKLAFVFRNYPLQEMHRYAVHAAMAAEAAAVQDKFWQMHDILFENQENLHDESLVIYAKKIGLDIAQFEKDFGNKNIVNKIEEDVSSGNKSGVEGTPSFFINGEYFVGNWLSSDLEIYLQKLI